MATPVDGFERNMLQRFVSGLAGGVTREMFSHRNWLRERPDTFNTLLLLPSRKKEPLSR